MGADEAGASQKNVSESSTAECNRWCSRGRGEQLPKRAAEHRWKGLVATTAKRVREAGGTYREVAHRVGISEQTLRVWRRSVDDGAIRWRGLPPQRSGREHRQALLDDLKENGFHLSVESLQRRHPELAKREVADLVTRARRVVASRGKHRRSEEWPRAGVVWALDHTDDEREGALPRLVVRDLGSRRNLAAEAVEDKTIAAVIEVLTGLFVDHGPPLVLRVDGAFAGEKMGAFLEEWGVVRWVTHPGSPWENGSVERTNGDLKRRVRGLEEARTESVVDRDGLYEVALEQSNKRVHPRAFGGRTPEDVWRDRRPIQPSERGTLRDRFNSERASESRGLNSGREGRKIEAEVERRALVDLGYLVVRSVRVTPPISTRRATMITGV